MSIEVASGEALKTVDDLVNLDQYGPQELASLAIRATRAYSAAYHPGGGPVWEEVRAEAVRLPDELAGTALSATLALAERFELPASEFSVFLTRVHKGGTEHTYKDEIKPDDRDRYTVAHTAGSGLDLSSSRRRKHDPARSSRAIFDRKSSARFMIDVNGRQLDSRKGMTEAVYKTFIAATRAYTSRKTTPMPDSEELATATGQEQTRTWLTGEKTTNERRRLTAYGWHSGSSSVSSEGIDFDEQIVRFRPAVVIATVKHELPATENAQHLIGHDLR